jgi:methyltransferase (TIGR00027 family)
MVLVALEQSEPPGRRLVDDDLAARLLPAPTRWLVTATPPNPMRRLAMAAMEREGPGLWASMNCRKHYIADKVNESLDDIDAVVVLGAGFDTLAYRLATNTRIPIFEVDQPVNIARKTAAAQRALGAQPVSVRLVPLDFEHDDVLDVLTRHGYNRTAAPFSSGRP